MILAAERPTREAKACTKCGLTKPHSAFHKDNGTSDGLKYRCRLCTNEKKREWRKANSELIRGRRREEYWRNRESYLQYFRSDGRKWRHFQWKLENHFGITVDDYERMLDQQQGLCSICQCPPTEANGHRHKPRLHIDHCHETGIVRGLLCNGCNIGLGAFRDQPDVMERAIQYLNNQGASDA